MKCRYTCTSLVAWLFKILVARAIKNNIYDIFNTQYNFSMTICSTVDPKKSRHNSNTCDSEIN